MKNKKILELLNQMEVIEKELNKVIHQQEIQFNSITNLKARKLNLKVPLKRHTLKVYKILRLWRRQKLSRKS